MCATRRRRRALVRAFAAEIATTARAHRPRTVSTIFFGGGTPSLMEPATVGAMLDTIGKHWTVAPRRRDDARSQSDQRRGHALSRLSRRRRQSRVARRAGARRRCAEDSAACTPRRKRSTRVKIARAAFRALFVRPDLCAARPDAGGWRAELERAIARGRRASVALSAHHRAGHAVRALHAAGKLMHAGRRNRRARSTT